MSVMEEQSDDLFFDSSDFIRTSPGSPSSSKNLDERRPFGFANFVDAFWHRELKSVRERRKRFLYTIGFDEFMPSLENTHNGVEEGAYNIVAFGDLDSEKTTECLSTLSESLRVPDRSEGGNSYCSSLFKEDGLGQSTMLQELQTFFRLPDLKRNFSQREGTNLDKRRNKWTRSWWKDLIKKRHLFVICKKKFWARKSAAPKKIRTRVQRHRKRYMEFSALYKGQEIEAHKGLIRVLRFNTSGWYLASGGEDCIVRIWQVMEEEPSCKLLNLKESLHDNGRGVRLGFLRKSYNLGHVLIPNRVFMILESPLHEFGGHTSDILDLSWSSSDHLLSASKDKTVRLWKVGCDGCQKIFRHNDYVTCIQFNPVDGRYFISGSLDGKVRIWGVSESRVLNWADLREIVTALCYKPDGMGFVVGSVKGSCRIFDCTGGYVRLNNYLQIQGRKKSGKCITGIQFSPDHLRRIMISSADSSIRMFDGSNVVHKFRGLRKSKSHLSASFTWDGKYAVSVDEGSRIYIWNTGDKPIRNTSSTAKLMKTVRSCEIFHDDGATVAVTWPSHAVALLPDTSAVLPAVCVRGKDRFSMMKGSATWPEEKLFRNLPFCLSSPAAASWCLVIVSANADGTIRCYHNYGLPFRL